MAKTTAAEPTTAKPAEPATEPAEPEVTEPVSEPIKEPVKDAEFWKGKAQAMEADAKKAAKRLRELEEAEQARQDAAKSELEKTQARLAKAEAEAKQAKLDVMRRDVAAEIKLPAEFASRVQGDTPEEMKADAAKMLAAMPKPVPPALGPTNPGAPGAGETKAERKARLGI